MAGTRGMRSLGRSHELAAGDLLFDITADLAMVTERAAFAGAPELAVDAQPGTNRLNSGFGFDRLAIGAHADGIHMRKESAKMLLVRCLTAVRCLTTDRWGHDVREILFQDNPRFFELNALDAAAEQRIAGRARASREYMVCAIADPIAAGQLTIAVATSHG